MNRRGDVRWLCVTETDLDTLDTLDNYRRKVAALEMELAELRHQIDRLGSDDEVLPSSAADQSEMTSSTNLYVFDEGDDEAKAFDAFYRAYDGIHAKTRKFLLG